MASPKRFAIVGLGSRSRDVDTSALLGKYRQSGVLVGLCDVNGARMRWHNQSFQHDFGVPPVPTCQPDEFGRLVREQEVDSVIVTSIDSTHHRYIVEGVRCGCDVITEKPLTIDLERCQAILDAVKQTGRKVTVAFNYRYAPRNARVKELLADGAIGDVLSVHFEWLLDTRHGADYFRRWHRDKHNSGGLMVHKASHHFDLVNWWLGARPGDGLRFRATWSSTAARTPSERGVARTYERAFGSDAAGTTPSRSTSTPTAS